MNNNSNKLKIIGLSIIIVALIALVIWFLKNLAFSFSTMLIIAILAIVAEFLFFMGHPKQNDSNDGKRVRFAIMLIGCFGILAVFAMKNYFYPGKEVFSNNDHHAIAL